MTVKELIGRQTMIYKTLLRKLKMEQHEPHSETVNYVRTINAVGKAEKDKRSNHDIQNTTQKTKE